MLLKSTLLATAYTIVFAGAAEAKGWYVSLEAGVNTVSDTDVQWAQTSAGLLDFTTNVEGRFDTGWALLASVGYALQNWRVEWELGWRSNDKNRFDLLLVSTGSLDELTLMFNMAYDIPFGQALSFSIGGGAGVDYAMLDIVNADDSSLNFAYQGLAALNYAVAPDVTLTLGYRYLHVLDPEFKDGNGPIGTFYSFDDLSKHAVTVGVRYTFAP